jgi:phosphoribosylamine---glycine ligase
MTEKMKVLLLGSGGREHAIGSKLIGSPLLSQLYIAPGNAGTARIGTNVPMRATDFPAIRDFVLKENINMVVVGPEDPLVFGIHDYFINDENLNRIPVIGPLKAGAMLEGSKEFAKAFMLKHGIPTAACHIITKENLSDGIGYISNTPPPYVLKADGLAAGKGVIICSSPGEAVHELRDMIVGARFGEASSHVVIEEFLSGIELSVFILTDGISYKIFPVAKDYKRIGEGDTGPNTGGMGSVSPVPFADQEFMEKVEKRIILPTMSGLKLEGIEYKGFIYFGLMKVKDDPYVIEYNCRLGDPETEAVLPRVRSDLLELFVAVAEQKLEHFSVATDPLCTATVMLVSKGYPGTYEKGKVITGEENVSGSLLFHAGTAIQPVTGRIISNGGRVMAITSSGKTLKEALMKSYASAESISFEGKGFRKDIGFDLAP